MSKLEKMIAELCPNGVVFKKLGDLGSFYGGITGKSKEDFKDGNAIFITYKNVYANPSLDTNPLETVKIGLSEKQRTLALGDVVFTGSSETPDECGISSVVTVEPAEPLYLNSFCFFFRFNNLEIMLPDFAKHLFRSSNLRYQIGKTASGVTRFNVSKKLMEKVSIPVPPLEVQREIVRVLDNFTLLSAELSAELKARKEQYQFYRDKAFVFNDDTQIKKIGDVTRVFSAARVHKNEWTKSGVPFYRSSDVMSALHGVENPRGKAFISYELYEKLSAKSGKIEKDDLLVTGGGSIGIPFLVTTDDPLYVKDADLLCIKKNDKLDNKFLYHYFFTSQFRNYLANITHDATIAHYTITQIVNTPVPVPSINRQKMIVDMLDQFNILTNDIFQGLPAEIRARQKQYEYYRDKLLTFKEIETA